MRKNVIGPDLRELHSFQELPIGSTITGIGAQTVPTGSWRFHRPQLRETIPPCQSHCPAGVNIRGFISLIKKKRFEDAYKSYTLENPFPGICGQSCDHPCERNCLRNALDEPVDIQDLELFLFSNGGRKILYEAPKPKAKGIALVGNSVSVLTCVYHLRQLGHVPKVFIEKNVIDRVSTEILETLELAPSRHLKTELEGVLNPDDLLGVEAGLGAERLDGFDAVVWGLDSEVPCEVRGFFQLPPDTESISRAIGIGKDAAISVDLYLRGKDLEGLRSHIEMGASGPLSMDRYIRTIHNESLYPLEVIGQDEINLRPFKKEYIDSKEKRPIDQKEAVKAAKRCFQCGKCTFCGRCLVYCPDQALEPEPKQKRVIFDYAFCKGCGICAYECPRGAIGFAKEEAVWQ